MYKTFKIKAQANFCLGEAWRRLTITGNTKSLTDPFLGLGTPTEYKQAIEAGFMRPSFPEVKKIPRACNWYQLTSVGQAIIKQMVRKYGYKKPTDTPRLPNKVKINIDKVCCRID